MNHKPILSIICNNMGTILVIRTPRSRQWLFNLSISVNLENTLITLKGHAMKTLSTLCLLFACLFLMACEQPTKNNGITDAQWEKVERTSTRYIMDSTKTACWYNNGKDSLKVGTKRYTISMASRYRVDTLPYAVLKDWLNEDGLITEADWAIYRDTQNDTIYIFADCETVEGPKLVLTHLDTLAMISTRYISEDSLSASCWFPWPNEAARDSLDLNGKRYTVSSGSRYRSFLEPEWLGDTVLEGAVKYVDPIRLYKDTKTDSIYILNPCDGLENLKAMHGVE